MVASKLFTEEDRAAISAAVREAEKKTSGEIVPVVATSSHRYDRAEDLFGLALAGVAVSVCWFFLQDVKPSGEAWSTDFVPALGLLEILGIFFGGWIIGMILADRIPLIKKPFAKHLFHVRVAEAAADAFARNHVRGTKGGTGIVIYVSLYERVVAVEADPGISDKVEPEEWKGICAGLVKAMKEKRHREGFVEAIAKCGELLSKHFPVEKDDVDELGNELRVID